MTSARRREADSRPQRAADPFRFTTIAHTDHEIMSPLAGEAVDRLLDGVHVRQGGDVLDIGCGNGAMLLRLVRRAAARGVGLDRNPAMIDRARRRGAGLSAEWFVGDAAGHALLARRWDATLCVGATGALGGLLPALGVLHGLVGPGGAALIGEGYWRCEPDPAYLEALGASRDEMTGLDDLRRRVESARFEITTAHVSSVEEWDEYEGRYASAIDRFVADHPDDPDAPAFAERINRWRAAYERWGRDTLGFATMALRAVEC